MIFKRVKNAFSRSSTPSSDNQEEKELEKTKILTRQVPKTSLNLNNNLEEVNKNKQEEERIKEEELKRQEDLRLEEERKIREEDDKKKELEAEKIKKEAENKKKQEELRKKEEENTKRLEEENKLREQENKKIELEEARRQKEIEKNNSFNSKSQNVLSLGNNEVNSSSYHNKVNISDITNSSSKKIENHPILTLEESQKNAQVAKEERQKEEKNKYNTPTGLIDSLKQSTQILADSVTKGIPDVVRNIGEGITNIPVGIANEITEEINKKYSMNLKKARNPFEILRGEKEHKKGLTEGVVDQLQKATNLVTEAGKAHDNKEQTTIETGYQVGAGAVSGAFGIIGEVIGGALATFASDEQKEFFSLELEKALGTQVGQKAMEIANNYDEYKKELKETDPRKYRNIVSTEAYSMAALETIGLKKFTQIITKNLKGIDKIELDNALTKAKQNITPSIIPSQTADLNVFSMNPKDLYKRQIDKVADLKDKSIREWNNLVDNIGLEGKIDDIKTSWDRAFENAQSRLGLRQDFAFEGIDIPKVGDIFKKEASANDNSMFAKAKSWFSDENQAKIAQEKALKEAKNPPLQKGPNVNAKYDEKGVLKLDSIDLKKYKIGYEDGGTRTQFTPMKEPLKYWRGDSEYLQFEKNLQKLMNSKTKRAMVGTLPTPLFPDNLKGKGLDDLRVIMTDDCYDHIKTGHDKHGNFMKENLIATVNEPNYVFLGEGGNPNKVIFTKELPHGHNMAVYADYVDGYYEIKTAHEVFEENMRDYFGWRAERVVDLADGGYHYEKGFANTPYFYNRKKAGEAYRINKVSAKEQGKLKKEVEEGMNKNLEVERGDIEGNQSNFSNPKGIVNSNDININNKDTINNLYENYSKNYRSNNGIIINADEIKPLFVDYNESISGSLQRESGILAQRFYEKSLDEIPSKEVIITAGGPASGKSEILVNGIEDKSDKIIFEGTGKNYDKLIKNYDKAIKAGKTPKVEAILIDIDNAINFSKLRTRNIAEDALVSSHKQLRETLLKIITERPDIDLNVRYNTGIKVNNEALFINMSRKNLINYLQRTKKK